MSRPALSVLLPFRDAADTLTACIESTLSQSFGDFELLAVDDGSTDDSCTIVHEHASRDPRVRLLSPEGRGIVSALNSGLHQARADIIVRMDADDLMLPGRLASHAEHLRHDPSLAVSATQVDIFPAETLRSGFREYLRWQNGVLSPAEVANEIYVEAPFAHPAVAYRKSVVMGIGGYRQGDFPEDYDLWLRLFHSGAQMAKIPRVLLAWRDHHGRLSRKDPRYARTAFDRLRSAYLARDPRLRACSRPLWVWGAGRRTRRRADHLLSRGFSPSAWIDIDPRKIGNRIAGAPVVSPDALEREPRPFVLVYVANHGARELIRGCLAGYGYSPGKDFLVVG